LKNGRVIGFDKAGSRDRHTSGRHSSRSGKRIQHISADFNNNKGYIVFLGKAFPERGDSTDNIVSDRFRCF